MAVQQFFIGGSGSLTLWESGWSREGGLKRDEAAYGGRSAALRRGMFHEEQSDVVGVLQGRIRDLEEQVKLLKAQVGLLKAQLRYWKWEAVRWGSREFDGTFTEEDKE